MIDVNDGPEAQNDVLLEGDSEGELDTDSTKKSIVCHKADRSLSEFKRWHDRGDLNTAPDWQREFVWDVKRSSRLIESILMDFPIPVIYLAKTPQATYEVIDGRQRLTSIFEFFNNKFSLSSMQSLKDLEGKRFSELEKPIQRKLEDAILRTFELAETTDKNTLFIIFERLNTGGIALNEMEIRNCIYSGTLSNCIKKLTKNPDFNNAIKGGRLSKRMADCALVLRFLAFSEGNYKKCKNLKEFLNDFMRDRRNPPDNKLSEYEQTFKQAMKACYTVFGEDAFRVKEGKKGGWSRKVNASIFQVIAVTLSYYDQHQITTKADAIYEEYLDMLANDSEWVKAVTKATANSESIKYAFEAWQKRLDAIMATVQPLDKTRCFSKQLKRELFNLNKQCTQCGNDIISIDDAQVDHIVHYWRGGQTIPENARLAHRICNQKRSKEAA